MDSPRRYVLKVRDALATSPRSAYVVICALAYCVLLSANDFLFLVLKAFFDTDKILLTDILVMTLWIIDVALIIAAYRYKKALSRWLLSSVSWIFVLIPLWAAAYFHNHFIWSTNLPLFFLLQHTYQAVFVLILLHVLLHEDAWRRSVPVTAAGILLSTIYRLMKESAHTLRLSPKGRRSFLVWIFAAGSGLIFAAVIARTVFMMVPTTVPYVGTVGYELWAQRAQRVEDLTYFAFLISAVAISFSIWFLFKKLERHSSTATLDDRVADRPKSQAPHGNRKFRRFLTILLIAFAAFSSLIVFPESLRMELPPTDLFHPGEAFVPTMQLETGDLPYIEAWPIHGLIIDTMPVMIADKLNLEPFYGTMLVLAILRLVSWFALLYVLAWLSSPGIALFVGGVLIASGQIFYLRILPLLLLVRLIGAIHTRHSKNLLSFGAGLLAVLSMLYSQDTGYTAIAVTLVFGGLWFVLNYRHGFRAITPSLSIMAGLLVGFAAVALWIYSFSGLDGLRNVIETHRWVLQSKVHQDSIAFPDDLSLWSYLTWFKVPILIALMGFAYLARQPFDHRITSDTRWKIIWPAIMVMAFIWYKKVLDRSDFNHMISASTFAPLIFVSLYQYLKRISKPTYAIAFFCLFAALNIHNFDTLEMELNENLSFAKLREWQQLEPDKEPPGFPWPDKVRLNVPKEWMELNAEPLLIVQKMLDENQTFFDFSNSGLSYYLLDKKPPTRYSQALHIMNEAMQEEVVDILKQKRPPSAILRMNDGAFQAIDEVENLFRHSLISTWLLANMSPYAIGDFFVILGPQTLQCEDTVYDIRSDLDLKYLPMAWGLQPPFWMLNRGVFDRKTAWTADHTFTTMENHSALSALMLRINTEESKTVTMRWGYGVPEQQIHWEIQAGDRMYLIPVGTIPGWVWSRSPLDLELPEGVEEIQLIPLPKDLADE